MYSYILYHSDCIVFPASGLTILPGVDKYHKHGVLGVKNIEDTSKPLFILADPSSLENETRKEKEEHHQGFAFNKYRSDATPLDRFNGDFRSNECKTISYPDVKVRIPPPHTNIHNIPLQIYN